MSVLVTGAAGFIGSILCENLAELNQKIVGIDNFDDYYDPAIKQRNLKKLKTKKNFKFLKTDITNQSAIEKIFENHPIEKIVHLAARAGVRPSIVFPQLYAKINIEGTINLLEQAKKHKLKNFVFASSSSVYGKTNQIPFRETQNLNPVSPYACSKVAGEIYCKTYSELYDLNVSSLRFFTVYGPRQRPEMAIHKFTSLIANQKVVPMYGDGSTKRDYTYITDVVEGVISALNKEFRYEVFNLGNNNTIELKTLINGIGEALKMKPKIKVLPIPQGDVSITYADISRAKSLLNYNPQTKIQEGLEKFVEWYKQTQPL